MKTFVAGSYLQRGRYRSFQPNPINRRWELDNMELQQLLGKADRELGRLDMFSDYVPNIDLFIRMHVLKEATQSSRIEGTRTNIEDALLDAKDIAPEDRDDWEEVQNYVAAMNAAIGRLETLPLSSRLAREAHEILLQGVRGKDKRPGEFRQSQNWIGGASIEDAAFIPPIHTSIAALMADLEAFVHDETHYFPELLKIALVHYQFETIHPFLDGNGRVGRLLITLYLVDKGILKRPILYLSDFFERNRTLYYDNLMIVRDRNDLAQWFKFFLVGIIETAQGSIDTFARTLELQKEIDEKIQSLGSRAVTAQKVMHYLYQRPVIDAAAVGQAAEVSPSSAYRLLAELERMEIIREMTGAKRGRVYYFTAYVRLYL